jgi:hypothetical protein
MAAQVTCQVPKVQPEDFLPTEKFFSRPRLQEPLTKTDCFLKGTVFHKFQPPTLFGIL